MPKIIMYATSTCPYCINAERLLLTKGVRDLNKILVDAEPQQRTLMMELSGRRTVPQIFINERHIGGFDDLRALDEAGELDALLVD
jgi:glutaredoxin 3